jgi:NADPH:quinone reductase-like Zn-dependent oxidoreductase
MKAITLSAHGGSENFRLAELPLPPLRKGDVRIRVRSVSFNPVDYQIRKGQAEGRNVTSPVLGRDLSGIVDAVHGSVGGFRPGDEVYSYVCDLASSGTYAEYVSVPEELVAKKPVTLSHDQAAAVPVAGITAWLALDKAARGRSLFLAGAAGGVGTFAIMLARQRGIGALTVTAGNPRSRAYLIESLGLAESQIVNYRDENFIAQALRCNDGFFDGVLDFVGGRMLSACCRLVAIDGNLASITEAPAAADVEYLFQRNGSFHAIGANAYSLTEDRSQWRRYQGMLGEFATLFDGGALPAPPVTSVGSLSVEAVRRAHDLLERSAVQGKLVMGC